MNLIQAHTEAQRLADEQQSKMYIVQVPKLLSDPLDTELELIVWNRINPENVNFVHQVVHPTPQPKPFLFTTLQMADNESINDFTYRANHQVQRIKNKNASKFSHVHSKPFYNDQTQRVDQQIWATPHPTHPVFDLEELHEQIQQLSGELEEAQNHLEAVCQAATNLTNFLYSEPTAMEWNSESFYAFSKSSMDNLSGDLERVVSEANLPDGK